MKLVAFLIIALIASAQVYEDKNANPTLDEHNFAVSAANSVEFDINATCDEWVFKVRNVQVAADDSIDFRVKVGGAIESGASDYRYTNSFRRDGGGSSDTFGPSAGATTGVFGIVRSDTNFGIDAGDGDWNGDIIVYAPGSTGTHKSIRWFSVAESDTDEATDYIGGAQYVGGTTALTGVQIFTQGTNNMDGGQIFAICRNY